MQISIAQFQRQARQLFVKLLDSHADAAAKGGESASVEWRRASDVARVLACLDPAILASEGVEDEMDTVGAEVAEEISGIFSRLTEGKKAARKPRQVTQKKRRGSGKARGRGARKLAAKKTGRKASAKKTGRTKVGSAPKKPAAKAKDPAAEAIREVLRIHGRETKPAEVIRLVKEQHGHDVTPRKVGAVRRNFKD